MKPKSLPSPSCDRNRHPLDLFLSVTETDIPSSGQRLKLILSLPLSATETDIYPFPTSGSD